MTGEPVVLFPVLDDGVALPAPVVTPRALFDLEEAPAPHKGAHLQGAPMGKGKRSMLAASGLYGDEGVGRREGDFYPTPYEATRALLRSLSTPDAGPLWWPMDELDWWEPTCGDGHICRVVEERTPGRVFASDLADRGYGVPGVDFTTAGWPDGADPAKTVVIGNPPYERHLCPLFIRHALADLGALRCAWLLKATYWHADERQALFAEYPPTAIYPLTWRLDFTGAGSPAMETAWMVWDMTAPASPWPRVCPLRKGDDTGDLFAQE